MKQWLSIIGIYAVIICMVAGLIWYEASLWSECRSDHSWMYCVRVLGK